MSSVDDRIVNMQFNNKQFESGVSQTKQSLASLESSIANTAKSKGLDGFGNAVDGVKHKFSAMQVAGVAAVATIASKATSLGLHLLKSFTLDPLTQGFQEYQTNLNSIQTIMANTGKSVGVVNKYLLQLNHYSDATIYNFGQMAASIGKFTAAGVNIKDATSSIKGMANTAALGGANIDQLNTAMYQMSQALASGTIRLMDWNSMVNANMGGKNVQKTLIATADTFGQNADAMVAKAGSFRESLASGWLTAKIFNKSMTVMAGTTDKATGKTIAFSIAQLKAQGYTEAQAKSLHKLSQAAIDSATVIKTLPQLMDVVKEAIGSVWSQSFQDIFGNFNQSKKLWTAVGTSIQGRISLIGNSLHNMLMTWQKEGGRLNVINGIKAGFKDMGLILSAVGKAWRDVFPPASGDGLHSITKAFRMFMTYLRPSQKTLEDLRNIFGGVFAVLHIGFSIVTAIAAGFGALFGAMFKGSGQARGGILDILSSIGLLLKGFDQWLTSGGKLTTFMKGLGTVVGASLQPALKVIGLVIQAFAALASGQGIDAFLKPLKEVSGIISPIAAQVVALATTIHNNFSKAIAPFPGLVKFFDGVKTKIASVVSVIKGFKNALTGSDAGQSADGIGSGIVDGIVKGLGGDAMAKIKSAVAFLAKAIPEFFKTLLGIHSPATALVPVGDGIVQGVAQGMVAGIQAVFGAIGEIGKAIGNGFKSLFSGTNALGIASLMNAVFSGALILEMRSFAGSLKGVIKNIGGVFSQLSKNLKTMQQEVKAKIIQAIAISLLLLSASVLILSTIDVKTLSTSLGAIGAMLAEMMATLFAMSKIKGGDLKMAALAAAMVAMSAAMVNLAVAVTILGHQDMKTLAKGIGAVAIVMGIMTVSLAALSGLGKMSAGASLAMLAMSTAMVILSGAVLAFGKMDMGTLAKGLGSMAIAIGIMTVSLGILGLIGPSVAAAGGGILLVSAAMVVLAGAVLAFGKMDLKTLAKGFGAVAIAIGIFTLALLLLGANVEGTVGAAGAMVLMATAMALLVPVIATLGQMDMGTLAKGIGALAVVLALFVAAIAAVGIIATVVGPGLLIFGAALALAGLGMLAFGTGFALMAAAGVAGVAVLTAGFSAIMALLPTFALQAAAAFVTFLAAIAAAAPKIRAALDTIFQNLLGIITDNIPAVTKLFQKLIDAGISVIRNSAPQFVDLGFDLIDKFLKSAEKHIPSIAKTATKIIVDFIHAISNNINDVVSAGADLIISFITGLGKNAAKIVNAAGKAVLTFLRALDGAVTKYQPQIEKEAVDIAGHFIDGLTGGLLGKGVAKLEGAVKSLLSHIPKKVREFLGISSPSKLAIYWGKMIGAGLVVGLNASVGVVVGSTIALANAVIAAGNRSVLIAQNNASTAQIAADKAKAKADATAMAAQKVKKSNPALSKKLTAQATAQQKAADAAQARADAAAQAVSDTQTFVNSDAAGKGDIYAGKAKSLSDQATAALTKANAEATEAKKLQKTNRAAGRAMLAQSRKDATAARSLANAAAADNAAANKYYAQSVTDRITQLEADRKAEDDARKAQADYDAASTQGKSDIMAQRAADDQKKADAANAAATDYIAQAKKIANSDHTKAMALLDLADAQAAAAQTLTDQAADEKDQAAQLADQAASETGGTSAGGGTSSPLTPSASILEDAASVVDRYSESLALATADAASGQPTVQYVQNNTSPIALSASEVYRQTKNLLSAQEVKMAGNN